MRKFIFIGPLNNLPYCCFEDKDCNWHLAYWLEPLELWIYLRRADESELPELINQSIPDQEAQEYFSRGKGIRNNFLSWYYMGEE